MFPTITVALNWSSWLIEALQRWRYPETDESRAVLAQIEARIQDLTRIDAEIDQLREQELRIRVSAKRAAPSFFHANRQALKVNIVAGLIVGVPIFLLGVVVTLLLT
jgi:hypothetical protein